MTRVILKGSARLGAWTSSARRSRLCAAPVRQVVTQDIRQKPKLTRRLTSPWSSVYVVQILGAQES
jgi:hypothetical protein